MANKASEQGQALRDEMIFKKMSLKVDTSAASVKLSQKTHNSEIVKTQEQNTKVLQQSVVHAKDLGQKSISIGTANLKLGQETLKEQKQSNSMFKNFSNDFKANLKRTRDAQAEQDKNKYSDSGDEKKMFGSDKMKDFKSKGGLFGKLAFWASMIGTQMSDFTAKIVKSVSVAFKVLKLGKVKELLKPVVGFAKAIGSTIGKVTGIFGKVFGKVAKSSVGGKLLVKGAGKLGLSALKKIPGIGALVGIALGIQRFKKGQTVEGIMEIASGFASIIPGFGTAASLIIDAALLAKDTGAFDGIGDIASKIPFVGKYFSNGTAKNVVSSKSSSAVSSADQKASSKASNGFSKSLKSNYNVSTNKGYSSTDDSTFGFKSPSYTQNTEQETEGVSPLMMQSPAENAIKLQDGNEDIQNLKPTTLNKLRQMSSDYMSETGEQLQVNSAYRSLKEQKYLFENLPKGRASAPGGSMHNFGVAIDIPSAQVNQLKKTGLLGKYNFNTPYATKEPWHLQDNDFDHNELLKKGAKVKADYFATGKLPSNTHFAAEGAVLNRPIIAGEAGPEAIIPLNDRGIGVIAEAMNKHMSVTGNEIGFLTGKSNGMNGMKKFLSSTFAPTLAMEIAKAMAILKDNTSNSQPVGIMAIG